MWQWLWSQRRGMEQHVRECLQCPKRAVHGFWTVRECGCCTQGLQDSGQKPCCVPARSSAAPLPTVNVKRRRCATWTGRSRRSPSRVCRCDLGSSGRPQWVWEEGEAGGSAISQDLPALEMLCLSRQQSVPSWEMARSTEKAKAWGRTVTLREPGPVEMASHVSSISSKSSRALTCAGLSRLSTGTPRGKACRYSLGRVLSRGTQEGSQHTHNTERLRYAETSPAWVERDTDSTRQKTGLWIPQILLVGSRLRELSS